MGPKTSISSLSWSTPIRRKDSEPLPSVPNEVYLEIFDYFQVSDELNLSQYKELFANVALVCRFFCATALSRMFKSLVFCGSPHANSTDAPGYAAFCRAAIKGQEPALSLTRYVKDCEFRCWESKPEDDLHWAFNAFLSLYSQAIVRMANLETLTFYKTPINKQMLKAICKAKQLKKLQFQMCTFVNDVAPGDIEKLSSSLKLTTFKLDGYVTDSCPKTAKWLSKTMASIQLQSMRTSIWPFASRYFAQAKHFTFLETLDLYHVEDLIPLFKFLESCSALTSLKVDTTTNCSFKSLPILPKTALTNLEELSCPPFMLEAIVPGRPVGRISFAGSGKRQRFHYTPWNDFKTFIFLKKSLAPIRLLRMPGSLYTGSISHEHFPHLEELHLDFELQQPLKISDLQSEFKHQIPAPSVCRLYLDGKYDLDATVNLQLQHNMITSFLTIAFPSLMLFQMRFVQWRRCELGAKWRVFALLSSLVSSRESPESHSFAQLWSLRETTASWNTNIMLEVA